MSATVMIVGPGAREHALSVAYERSPAVGRIVVAPGCDFHAWNRQKEVIRDPSVSIHDPATALAAAQKHQVDLVDVAQDDALAVGTVDLLTKHGIAAFGPTRDAAQIEWDKAWSRQLMADCDIPLPAHRSFTLDDRAAAEAYLKQCYADDSARLVFVKAAGLAAGKGALRASSLAEATARLDQLADFGDAGHSFVIEDGLVGEEYSYYAISDGKNWQTFPSAQDNKLSQDGDRGEQTGGIGVTSPTVLTADCDAEIQQRQIAPALAGLAKLGRPYCGILYLGGIITADGLNTIEYNARWGDPEVQTILPGFQGDYFALIQAALAGQITDAEFGHDGLTRVCVVGCAQGYPGDYAKVTGSEITGLAEAVTVEGVEVYGSAVKVVDGKCYADGGRLFSVVGSGGTVAEAQDKAYQAIDRISIAGDGLHYRTDIGDREKARRG